MINFFWPNLLDVFETDKSVNSSNIEEVKVGPLQFEFNIT